MAGWHFIYVPKKQSAEIKARFGNIKRGWGSIPVLVRVGGSAWKTSIFPTKKGTYFLAIKAAVRKKEGIKNGDTINFTLEVRS